MEERRPRRWQGCSRPSRHRPGQHDGTQQPPGFPAAWAEPAALEHMKCSHRRCARHVPDPAERIPPCSALFRTAAPLSISPGHVGHGLTGVLSGTPTSPALVVLAPFASRFTASASAYRHEDSEAIGCAKSLTVHVSGGDAGPPAASSALHTAPACCLTCVLSEKTRLRFHLRMTAFLGDSCVHCCCSWALVRSRQVHSETSVPNRRCWLHRCCCQDAQHLHTHAF